MHFWQVEYCLRQLKTFSPQAFGCVDDIGDEQIKFGRKCRSSDQLIELPIEHQIYDMIDAAGSEGLTVMEVGALISCLCFNILGATPNAWYFFFNFFSPLMLLSVFDFQICVLPHIFRVFH